MASHIGLYTLAASVFFRQIAKESSTVHDGKENMVAWRSIWQNYAICIDDLAKINMICHFYLPNQLEYS